MKNETEFLSPSESIIMMGSAEDEPSAAELQEGPAHRPACRAPTCRPSGNENYFTCSPLPPFLPPAEMFLKASNIEVCRRLPCLYSVPGWPWVMALGHAQSRTGAGDALGLAGQTGTSVGFCHLPPGGRPSVSRLPLWSLCLGEGGVVGSRWEEKEGDGREVSGQCPTGDRVGPFW